MRKLTLSLDPEVIEEARQLAKEDGTSVSSMFERFIRLLAIRRRNTGRFGPLTQKATGMISLTGKSSEQQILQDALVDKYGLR